MRVLVTTANTIHKYVKVYLEGSKYEVRTECGLKKNFEEDDTENKFLQIHVTGGLLKFCKRCFKEVNK